MISDRDNQTLMKVLRLGLHATASEGEWQAAMIKAGQIMRRLQLTPEDVLGANTRVVERVVYRDRPATSYDSTRRGSSNHDEASQRDGSWIFWFGKHKGKTVSEIAKCDLSYLRWAARTLANLPEKMMAEIKLAIDESENWWRR